MSNNFRSRGNNLNLIFQPFASANATQAATLSAAVTRYRNSAQDINTRYAGRDNRAGNAVSLATLYRVNSVDLINIFNKINAEFVVTIGGSFTYSPGVSRTPTLSYSPTNVVVPNITTKINAGTYTPSATETASTVAVGRNIPSTYVITRSGSMIIAPRPVSFTFSGGFTYDGVARAITDFITTNLPAGITYAVSGGTNPIFNAGIYNSSDYTITITNDLQGNYSISKSGFVQISQLSLQVFVSGSVPYNGSSYFPSFTTSPEVPFGTISLNTTFTEPGIYSDPQNWSWSYDTNNIQITSYSGSFEIYVDVVINIFGTFGYEGPFTSYFPFYTVSPSAYNSFISQAGSGYTYPGTYYGFQFLYQFSSSVSYVKIQSVTGFMTILPFSGTIDLTQTVNSNGIGNLVSLVSNGFVSPSLPGVASYSVTNIGISDPGGGPSYPKYVSATNGNCSYSIIGDNAAYYNLTITGTITILAPPN